MMKKIGFTSTIPVEILFASGAIPVDLNNFFVTHPQREEFLKKAERKGLPRTVCAWIKGIYVAFLEEFDSVIFVEGGDCSNTVALREVADFIKKNTYSFHYPSKPDLGKMEEVIREFSSFFGVKEKKVEGEYFKLKKIREKLKKIDLLTYQEGVVSGEENFLYLLGATDFEGDYYKYEKKIDIFLDRIKKRKDKNKGKLRLGVCGVPTIFQDLFSYLDELGVAVVYNEIPLEFAILKGNSIAESYTRYTYPYGINYRIRTIAEEIKHRQLDGIIHYVQSFCYRNIEDIVLKKSLSLPVLTLEGDESFYLTPRDKLRIENFVEMLKD